MSTTIFLRSYLHSIIGTIGKRRIGKGQKVSKDFFYTSDNNDKWLTGSDLKEWISKTLIEYL